MSNLLNELQIVQPDGTINTIKTTPIASSADYATGTSTSSVPSVAQVKTDVGTLTNLINGKQDTLTAGNNITITDNTISAASTVIPFATDEEYAAGESTTVLPNVKQVQDSLDVLNTKLSTVYSYKGTVANRAALPTDASVGDVYNLEDTGMNTAWNGTEWDDLGSTVDLSNYVQSEALAAGLATKQDTLTAGNHISITDNVIAVSTAFATIATAEEATDGTSTTTALSVAQAAANLEAVNLALEADIAALNTEKQDRLTAGDNIQILNNVISAIIPAQVSELATDEEWEAGTITTKAPTVQQVTDAIAEVITFSVVDIPDSGGLKRGVITL